MGKGLSVPILLPIACKKIMAILEIVKMMKNVKVHKLTVEVAEKNKKAKSLNH